MLKNNNKQTNIKSTANWFDLALALAKGLAFTDKKTHLHTAVRYFIEIYRRNLMIFTDANILSLVLRLCSLITDTITSCYRTQLLF